MDPGPHTEHHTHHHSGMRWLDMAVGLSAILISVVSLYVAVQHGKTMEHMVEATTWPYVEFGHSNLAQDGTTKTVSLFVQNNGVGPAKIESFELWFKGQPIKSGHDLITACCMPAGAAQRPHYVSGTVLHRVIPAKDGVLLFRTNPADLAPGVLEKFDADRQQIRTVICYCSVLEECWLRDSDKQSPEKTKHCPTPKVPYLD